MKLLPIAVNNTIRYNAVSNKIYYFPTVKISKTDGNGLKSFVSAHVSENRIQIRISHHSYF